MKQDPIRSKLWRRVSGFAGDKRGALSVELLLALPILLWAYIATLVFYDAYRAQTLAQSGVIHVADLMSRKTDIVTDDYIEGMNAVYDFLMYRNLEARMRISAIRRNAEGNPEVAWSQGTRGIIPLDEMVELVSTHFSGAAFGDTSGWSSSIINHSSNPSVGSFLGPFGRDTRTAPVSFNLDLGQEVDSARIEFDLMIIDSWDGYDDDYARPEGDHLRILVNDTSIAAESFYHQGWGMYLEDRKTVANRSEGRFATTMTLIEGPAQLYRNPSWSDQIWRVSIEIGAPVQTFALGFSAALDEPISNEAFAILNMRVIISPGDRNPTHYIPTQSLAAVYPLNRFRTFLGCPDHRLSAQVHNIAADTYPWVLPPVEHRVRAGGATRRSDCPGGTGGQHLNATATEVIDWDSMGRTGTGNRLRIETEDYDSGRSCNTALLVRDPTGASNFAGNVGPGESNGNSRVHFASVPDGLYHVWVLTEGSSQCDTTLRITQF